MTSDELSESGPDLISRLMRVEWPADTHLGPACDSNGMSPLARDNDTNAITTHVRLHDIEGVSDEDKDDLSVRSAVIGAAVVAGTVSVIIVGKKLAPRARRAWDQRAEPVLRSAWARASKPFTKGTPEPRGTDVVMAAIQDEGPEMTMPEARELLAAALLARAFSDEQIELLRAARIIDGGDACAAERLLYSLTPQQLEEGSRLILESGSLEDLGLVFRQIEPQRQPLPRTIGPESS